MSNRNIYFHGGTGEVLMNTSNYIQFSGGVIDPDYKSYSGASWWSFWQEDYTSSFTDMTGNGHNLTPSSLDFTFENDRYGDENRAVNTKTTNFTTTTNIYTTNELTGGTAYNVNVSIAFWIYITEYPASQETIFQTYFSNDARYLEVYLGTTGMIGARQMGVTPAYWSENVVTAVQSAITLNTWTHVIVDISQNATNKKIYFNNQNTCVQGTNNSVFVPATGWENVVHKVNTTSGVFTVSNMVQFRRWMTSDATTRNKLYTLT